MPAGSSRPEPGNAMTTDINPHAPRTPARWSGLFSTARSPWLLPAVFCLLVLFALVIWPLAALFHQSILDPQTGHVSLAGFEQFFGNARYTTAFINTVILGASSTAGALLLGAPLA